MFSSACVYGLVTPLLRRVYGLFGVVVLLYLGFVAFEYSALNKERLYRKLLRGDGREKASAGFDLAYLKGEKQLIRALRSPSPAVREVAANSLWDLWSRAAGHDAFRHVRAANQAMDRQALAEALQILDRVIERYPDFSEGWNRRATLLWQMGKFHDSLRDARNAVALNPNHFGAWQGMGFCHVHLGDFRQACRCFRKALQITPHDPSLRAILERCEAMLHRQSPRTGADGEALLVSSETGPCRVQRWVSTP